MSYYDRLIEADYYGAVAKFRDQQQQDKKAAQRLMLSALLGGGGIAILLEAFIGHEFGYASFLGGIVGYVLGFQYCKKLWDIEKDMRDFAEALNRVGEPPE